MYFQLILLYSLTHSISFLVYSVVEAHKDHFAKLLDGVQTTSNSSTLLPAVKSEPPDFDFVETRATEIPLSCSVKVSNI